MPIRRCSSVFLVLLPVAVGLAQSPIPGLSNDAAGLAHWRQALGGAIQTARAGGGYPSMPRVNVTLVGHSLEEGIQDCAPPDLSDGVSWNYANLMRANLRGQLVVKIGTGARQSNRFVGSKGFIPAVDSGATPILAGPGSYIGGERYGAWTDHRFNDADMPQGACRRYMETSEPGARARFYVTYAPAWTRMRAEVPKSVQFVYQQLPGGGDMELSYVSYDETQVYFSQTISTASPDGQEHYGMLAPSVPATAPAGFWVRIRNVSSTPKPIRWEGCNFFTGDEGYGLHVVEYACGGAIADSYASDANVESIARTNPDLVVVWLDFNDVFGPRAHGVQFHRDSIEAMLQRIRARMPDVSILLKLGFDPVGGPWSTWTQMQSNLATLSLAYGCALFSHHEYAGGLSAEAFCVPRGIKEPNCVHFNRIGGQPFEAAVMGQILMSGV